MQSDWLTTGPTVLEFEKQFAKQVGAAEGIAVMVNSTLGYESIARGNKTAIFSIRGTMLGIEGFGFGWPRDSPDEGLFWPNNPDLDSFIPILDYLFEVDYVQWKKDVGSTNYFSLMVYNPGNSIFKRTLSKN